VIRFLCSLFAVKSTDKALVSPIVYADAPQLGPGAAQSAVATPSLSALQGLAAAGAQFGARDVVSIAAAKQSALHAAMTSAVANGLNGTSGHQTGTSLQSISRGVSGDGEGTGNTASAKIAPTPEEWVSLVTISHVEVSFIVALCSQLWTPVCFGLIRCPACCRFRTGWQLPRRWVVRRRWRPGWPLGSRSAARYVLCCVAVACLVAFRRTSKLTFGAWVDNVVVVGAQNGLSGRLRWLVTQLLEQHAHRLQRNPALSNGHSNHSSSVNPTSTGTSAHTCWSWLGTVEQPLQLLQTRVMPIVAKFPASHALLAEINHTMELMSVV
jgi:hypothetical protein